MSQESLPLLPDSTCGGGQGSVPVFNCIVILTRLPESGRLRGRIANLANLSAEGNAERELLLLLTKRFKAFILDCLTNQRRVPWRDPPESPAPGEEQRFIPVHL